MCDILKRLETIKCLLNGLKDCASHISFSELEAAVLKKIEEFSIDYVTKEDMTDEDISNVVELLCSHGVYTYEINRDEHSMFIYDLTAEQLDMVMGL